MDKMEFAYGSIETVEKKKQRYWTRPVTAAFIVCAVSACLVLAVLKSENGLQRKDGSHSWTVTEEKSQYKNMAKNSATEDETLKSQATSKYNYIGCYEDAGGRDIAHLYGNGYSVATCASACGNAGWAYFGVQYYGECWCDNDYGYYGEKPHGECNTPCNADTSVMCGGGWRNSVYNTLPAGVPECDRRRDNRRNLMEHEEFMGDIQKSLQKDIEKQNRGMPNEDEFGMLVIDEDKKQDKPVVVSEGGKKQEKPVEVSEKPDEVSEGGMKAVSHRKGLAFQSSSYIGCYADSGNRDLHVLAGNNMEFSSCASACSNYQYFALQYYGECWCDNDYGYYGGSGGCYTHCHADSSQTCGGPWANSVYTTCNTNGGKYCGTDTNNWTSYSPNGCVPDYWLCDDWVDCVDARDESCPSHTIPAASESITPADACPTSTTDLNSVLTSLGMDGLVAMSSTLTEKTYECLETGVTDMASLALKFIEGLIDQIGCGRRILSSEDVQVYSMNSQSDMDQLQAWRRNNRRQLEKMEKMEKMDNAPVDKLGFIADAAEDVGSAVAGGFEDMGSALASGFEDFADFVTEDVGGAFEDLGNFIAEDVANGLGDIANGIADVANAAVNGVIDIAEAVAEGLMVIGEFVVAVATAIWDCVYGFVTLDWDSLIPRAIQSVIDSVSQPAYCLVEAIQSGLTAMFEVNDPTVSLHLGFEVCFIHCFALEVGIALIVEEIMGMSEHTQDPNKGRPVKFFWGYCGGGAFDVGGNVYVGFGLWPNTENIPGESYASGLGGDVNILGIEVGIGFTVVNAADLTAFIGVILTASIGVGVNPVSAALMSSCMAGWIE